MSWVTWQFPFEYLMNHNSDLVMIFVIELDPSLTPEKGQRAK